MPDTHYILFYDYVSDVLERRVPHRDAHLAQIRAATGRASRAAAARGYSQH